MIREEIDAVAGAVRNRATITRLSHEGQIQAIGVLRDALVSVASDREDAVREMHARELHHFESEQAMEEALGVLRAASVPPGMTEAQFYRALVGKAARILQEATK